VGNELDFGCAAADADPGLGLYRKLMRWDQNAVWSVNTAAKQAARLPLIGGWMAHFVYGGDHLSSITLLRFPCLPDSSDAFQNA
jgi:hypothetical protein